MQLKHTVLSLLAICLSFSLFAQGIKFEHGKWDEVVAKAKAENKYIFVDAYAVWCGPCKWMAKNIFTEEKIGEHFNEHYISYKFDMEKGEGPAFAKKHGVMVYPTLLFFNPKGEIVHKSAGAKDVEALLATSAEAKDPDFQLFALKKQHKAGKLPKSLLGNYTKALVNAYEQEEAQKVSLEFLKSKKQTEWATEDVFEVISMTQMDYTSEVFKYVVEHKDDFVAAAGKDKVKNYIEGAFMQSMGAVLKAKDDEKLDAYKSEIKKLAGDRADVLIALLNMNYYRGTQEGNKYMIEYYSEHCDNYGQLNSIAWNYYENKDNKEDLELALFWIKRSIEIDKNWYNLDTKAHLEKKLGKIDAAIITAQEAVNIGQKAGEDVSETRNLLAELEKMEPKEEGIAFEQGSWEEIVAKAKAENKNIFVDAYAVWCGPCKWMAKNVFTDTKVGAHFNDKYISYKFDMEKGDGPAFAKLHKVMAYPTLLFFNPEGELIHKVTGAAPTDVLIQHSKDALDPNKQLAKLKQKFEDGERDPEFLYNYSAALMNAYEDASAPSTLYFEGLDKKEWITEDNFGLLVQTQQDFNSEIFRYVLQNEAKFNETLEEKEVNYYIQTVLDQHIFGFGQSKNEADYKAFKAEIADLVDKDNAKTKSALADYVFYKGSDKSHKYTKTYMEKYCQKWHLLNEAAWEYFENEESKGKLKSALKWASKSVELEANYYNLDTKANLEYKLGNNEEALATAQKAVEKASEVNMDPVETEALISKIEEALK